MRHRNIPKNICYSLTAISVGKCILLRVYEPMYFIDILIKAFRKIEKRGLQRNEQETTGSLSLIKNEFKFLINEYGFKISNDQIKPILLVIYEKNWEQIEISFEFPDFYFEIRFIDKISEKNLSLNDILRVTKTDKQIINYPGFFTDQHKFLQENIPLSSSLMKKHAAFLLSGDREVFKNTYREIKGGWSYHQI